MWKVFRALVCEVQDMLFKMQPPHHVVDFLNILCDTCDVVTLVSRPLLTICTKAVHVLICCEHMFILEH